MEKQAAKLRYQVEVVVRRKLMNGEEPYQIAKELGLLLPSVSAVNRKILAVAKQTLDAESDAMVNAVRNAVEGWEDNFVEEPGGPTEVQCHVCRTTSDWHEKWKPSEHRHLRDCLVVQARKILKLIEDARA